VYYKIPVTTTTHDERKGTELSNFAVMDGQYRKDIYPGLEVGIILKKDQRSGKKTYGIVKDLLTSAAYHSRGIKVRLEDGQIGRVVEIIG